MKVIDGKCSYMYICIYTVHTLALYKIVSVYVAYTHKYYYINTLLYVSKIPGSGPDIK